MPPRNRLRAFFRPSDEWLLVGLGGFLFFIGTNTQTGWLFVVDAFLAALLVLGFIMPRLTVRSLRVTRDTPPAASEGDVVTVRLRITNHSSWQRYLFTVLDTPAAAPLVPLNGGLQPQKPKKFVVGRIGPRATVTVEYSMHCPFRGAFPYPSLRLESATPVGLFPYSRTFPTADEMIVYPSGPLLRRLDHHHPSPRTSTDHRTYNRVGHSFDLQGIREYQWGDDTRALHWPSTARTGQLMVRQYRDIGSESVNILLENHALSQIGNPGLTPLDDAARLAASLVEYAQHRSGGLVLLSGKPSPPLVRPLVWQAMEWLARLNANGSETWCQILQQNVAALPRQGRLFVLATLPLWDEEVLQLLSERNLQVQVVLFEWYTYNAASSAVDLDEASLLPPPFRPEDYDALAGRLQAQRITVRRMKYGEDLQNVLSQPVGAFS